MGVLSDLIIADRDEAQAILDAGGAHDERWKCLESKGIDPIKLGTLWAILAGQSVDDIDAVLNFMGDDTIVVQGSDDGPWINAVPQALTDALVSIAESNEEAIAEKWANTEEFQNQGWQAADVEEYLHDLIAHARVAKESSKPLLLWMSL